jgi:ribonucleoside-diphosphate reductase alpha chain
MTDDSDIPEVSSVMDWLARPIALDYLPIEKRAALDVHSVNEEARTVTQASKVLI